jgi:hypothetical protein
MLQNITHLPEEKQIDALLEGIKTVGAVMVLIPISAALSYSVTLCRR